MNRTHLATLYRHPFGLFLDLYHITMAYGFWRRDLYQRRAVFHLFYRNNPFGHPFVVTSGLHLVVDLLERFQFTPDDISYLGRLKGADQKPLFDLSFLNFLQRLTFRCHIDAMPEGTVAFPHQPLLRVEGPLIQAQLIESALLNLINFSTLVSTKAARMVEAAGGDRVVEFGLRRAQGFDGAITATRSAYIGGCHGTSNVIAARHYDIPPAGTHAHSWVMIFDDELTAFREYAQAMPNNCLFLVDTYNTLEGVDHAIVVGNELRRFGHELIGIRLDSGDLAELSREARRRLDEAGFPDAGIVASDQIDEYRIAEIKKRGGQVATWGIGTRLVTAYDHPALGGVYKLTAITDEKGEWDYRLKLSEEARKTSTPGIQQVKRFRDDRGLPAGDLVYDLHLPTSSQAVDPVSGRPYSFDGLDGADLLVPVFRDGALVYSPPDIHAVRAFSLEQQRLFRQTDAHRYPVGLEKHLFAYRKNLIEQQEQRPPL